MQVCISESRGSHLGDGCAVPLRASPGNQRSNISLDGGASLGGKQRDAVPLLAVMTESSPQEVEADVPGD